MLKRLLGFLAVACVGLMLATACGDDDGGDEDGGGSATPTAAATASAASVYPLTIERSDGKTHTLEARPQRVVSLSPGATEIIYAIGAEDTLVAVDEQSDYPPAVASVSGRVDAFEPNVEAIAGFEPDLVVVASNTGGIVEALDRLEIPLLYQDLDTSVTTIDDVLELITLYGDVFDRADAADALVTDLQGRVEAVEEGVASAATDPPQRVYHELDSTFYSAAEGTFIGSLYLLLEAENIAGDGGGVPYPQLTQEAIIAANPDVIILADEEFGVTVESVQARPGWDAIAAVAAGRIYGIDPDIISRPGPRIVDALEQLAGHLYPEQFE